MQKVSLYDFDRTIYAKDTGTNLYRFIFAKYPLLWLTGPWMLAVTVLHALKLLSHERWKTAMLLPMTFFTLGEWRMLTAHFWKGAQKDFFPRVLQEMEADKKAGMLVGIISASLEIYLEPVQGLLRPDFIIGTKVHIRGQKITSRLDGDNCKEHEKVRRFHLHMERHYPGQPYELTKMVSDSLHDLPLYEAAKTQFTVEADGSLREGLPAAYSNDLTIK